MSDQLFRAAQAEETALIAELRQHPAFRKLEAVRALIATYLSANQAVQIAPAPVASVPTTRPVERSGSASSILARATEAYLSKRGRRAQVTEILPALQGEGHVIGGKTPAGTLSSILSHNPAFDNVRGKGYGLVAWSGGDGPTAGLPFAPAPTATVSVVKPGSWEGELPPAWKRAPWPSVSPDPTSDIAEGDVSVEGKNSRAKEEVA